MKQQRPYPRVVVSRKAARSLASGHPWVFAGEVLRVESAVSGASTTNGCLVDVFEDNGTWQGTGLISEQSQIRVRIVSRNANDRFDDAFWRRRIAYAWRHRVSCMGTRGIGCGVGRDLDACRVVFSEADGLPGLTVDRYGQVLVAQVGTYGMELLRPRLYPLLFDVLRESGEDVQAIYERNDATIREKEGLPRYKGWWDEQPVSIGSDETLVRETAITHGADPAPVTGDVQGQAAPLAHHSPTAASTGPAAPTTVVSPRSTRLTVVENDLRFALDLENSQKTGFFLDQKYNRRAVRELAWGRHVLDCFCHVGPFGLNAAAGGATSVRCVDVSQTALDLAAENAQLNHMEDIVSFTCADVLEYLPRLRSDRAFARAEGGPFDLIVLDPPAFTKSAGTVRQATRGYQRINYEALRLLPRGGYLATCSCSQHMTRDLLAQAIADAAHQAGVQLRQVEERQQAPDHPILWGFPPSHYLDFFIFQVV